MRKNDIEIAQNGLPSHRKPPEGIPNICKSRNLEPIKHTVYKIKTGLVEKKIKSDNSLEQGNEEPMDR